MQTRPTTVFHIAERAAWNDCDGAYTPTEFASDGFVHCSLWSQLFRVARALFAGRDDLIVLEIDVSRLEAPLRYEDLAGEGETFPHIYGPVPTDAVIGTMRVDWSASESSETPTMPEFHRVDGSAMGERRGEPGRMRVLSGDTRDAQAYGLG